jgi:hypothetical protein
VLVIIKLLRIIVVLFRLDFSLAYGRLASCWTITVRTATALQRRAACRASLPRRSAAKAGLPSVAFAKNHENYETNPKAKRRISFKYKGFARFGWSLAGKTNPKDPNLHILHSDLANSDRISGLGFPPGSAYQSIHPSRLPAFGVPIPQSAIRIQMTCFSAAQSKVNRFSRPANEIL